MKAVSVELFPLLVAIFVMVVPIITLAIIAFIKLMIKNAKRNKKSVETKDDIRAKFLAPFGEDNVLSISSNMNRVTVEVKDVNKVNFDGLRNLGVGILISGNVIKCSSSEFASLIEG